MKVSDEVRPLKNDCYCGDLVQYENKVCMVIKTGIDESNWSTYGLLCLEGVDAGTVIVDDATLGELDKRITGVLVRKSEVLIGRI